MAQQEGNAQASSRLWVSGPVRWKPSATVRAFEFLKANTALVPKVTLPAPILLHMFAGGDKGIREGHYKDIEQFWQDVVAAYRQEVRALVDAGASYIQFDDTVDRVPVRSGASRDGASAGARTRTSCCGSMRAA